MGYYSYPKGGCACHFSVSRQKSLKYKGSFACALKRAQADSEFRASYADGGLLK